jgi:hypothetical protein
MVNDAHARRAIVLCPYRFLAVDMRTYAATMSMLVPGHRGDVREAADPHGDEANEREFVQGLERGFAVVRAFHDARELPGSRAHLPVHAERCQCGAAVMETLVLSVPESLTAGRKS